MSIAFELGGSPLTNRVDLRDGLDGLTSNANYGELGGGGILIHDPLANLDVKGWTFFRVLETTATPPTIAAGFIYGRPITRFEGHSKSRMWDCDFVDLNTLLKFRVIHGDDGKRPAETDLARVAWLLGSEYLTDLGPGLAVVDSGLVNVTDNPVLFGEADYRGRYPIDVLGDIAGISAKQFFVYYDETDGASLFYDLATEPVKDAGVEISNDPDDIDPTAGTPILPPYTDQIEVTIFRSPEDVNSGVRYEYKGVAIYRERSATETEFGVKRDGTYSTDRVGKAATAEAQAAAWLENHSVEKDTITFEVQMLPEDVNKITAGDRIRVRWEHLPGYDPAVYTRVTQRIVRLEDAPEHYVLRLQCSLAVKHGEGGGGGGSGFPYVPPCQGGDIDLVQFSSTGQNGLVDLTITWPSPPTPGNLLYVHTTYRGTSAAQEIDGWNLSPMGTTTIDNDDEQSTATYWRIADGTETDWTSDWSPNTNYKRAIIAEFSGVSELSQYADEFTINTLTALGGEVTVPNGTTALVVTGMGYNTGGDTNPYPHADPVWSGGATMIAFCKLDGEHPLSSVGYEVLTPSSGSATQHILTFSGFTPNGDESSLAQTLVFICSGSGIPLPGQPVPPLPPTGAVDGTNPDYVAPFPFSDGSLQFIHDGIDQTDHVATYDGETGDFSLDYNPSSGSTLLTRILGR